MTDPSPSRPAPFWQRLPQIVLYPVRGAGPATLVGLTLASLLSYLPLVGLLMTLIVWGTAYKFAFEFLRSTADGRMDVPDMASTVENGVVWRLIGLQLVMFVVVIGAALLGGPLAGLAMLVLVVLMQPGCIISLAIDGSLAHALDPTTALSIMGRIGWPYLAVFALLFVIQASAATAGDWLSSLMPPVIAQLCLNLFAFWGLFAAFHLMGYLVYQYHEVLGYEPETLNHALPARRGERDGELLARAEALVRDGHNDAALEMLREEIRSRAVALDAHELYRRLLRSAGRTADADEHAGMYLNLLMMEKQERRALGLLRDALDANRDFVPLQLEHAEQLSERARNLGQAQLALDQWQAMLRRHPKAAAAPRWALEASLLLVDRFGRDDEARTLLQAARAHCSDEALAQKIDAALKPLQVSPA